MELPIYQVDAFTDKIFSGNPAAVVPLEKWLPNDILLKIAAENNLSETAFFVPNDKGFDLRWFTPAMEVDLCGHATLATSWVIYNELGYDKNEIHFESESGELIVKKSNNGFTLNFPIWESAHSEPEEIISQIFGKTAKALYKGKKWVAVFDDEQFIQNTQPDIALIKTIDSQGVIITAESESPNVDFVSRYFGPQVGIDEDPVTGSAHCLLTPIWAERLGKTNFKAKQASARGGDLELSLQNDRVFITGKAALYLKGTIYV